ncbi:olfactory receptor 11A1-like [Platichthys flesus]|uniref:olfactory receptor 11A1-like n=1 Tax=Platichthys flesus TaxID=8260 RepID=UPI002DB89A94|nr:olfactory receptor 11A1-like [Platichthys flesus]
MNSTSSYFVLEAYLPVGTLRYLFFMLTAVIYVFILISNTSLIVVICMNRSLHEPMYVFLCSLFVNELYGSTGLFPLLLLQILSDVHTVPRPLCFLQIFCLYTYVNVEFCNLAVMSYDRYLAICCPLQYNTRMTVNKAVTFITVLWFYSFVKFLITGHLLTSPLQLCGNFIHKVYCGNFSVVKLSCSDTTANNVYGLIFTFISIILPLVLILYTYVRIFKVCFSGSKQTRQKAVSTCTPHLASLLNFSFGCSFEIVQSRFNMNSLSLYAITCLPLFNPVLYGLNMTKIRTKFLIH